MTEWIVAKYWKFSEKYNGIWNGQDFEGEDLHSQLGSGSDQKTVIKKLENHATWAYKDLLFMLATVLKCFLHFFKAWYSFFKVYFNILRFWIVKLLKFGLFVRFFCLGAELAKCCAQIRILQIKLVNPVPPHTAWYSTRKGKGSSLVVEVYSWIALNIYRL